MGFWKRLFGGKGEKAAREELAQKAGAEPGTPRPPNTGTSSAAGDKLLPAPTRPAAPVGSSVPAPLAEGTAADSWRTRPVFISSTFRDMHAERDFLAQHLLPLLAERVRSQRIHLEPVDLRVGVETISTAEEEKKQLQVLKVCLDDIERSRPFMIVLIGDRYGWIPPKGRMDAAVQEKGFQTDTNGKSVTALEIEFGILKSPDQRKRSFFYFRDPLPYDTMDPDTAAIYSDAHNPGDPDAAESFRKLQALKAHIQSEYPDRVRHYTAGWNGTTVCDLGALEALILKDVQDEIEDEARQFAAQPPASDLDEFIEHCAHGFVGRADLLARLRAFALEPGTDWGLCLTGESGAGKSAVFARLHRTLEANKEILLLAHAAGIGPQSTSVDLMLRGWIARLSGALGVRDPILELESAAGPGREERKQASSDDLDKAFASLLRRAAETRRVVILVDALNQFEPTPRARHLTWLPAKAWPSNARLIATAIPGPESEALGTWTGAKLEELPPLTVADARAIVDAVYARYHRTPNPDVVRALLEKKRSGDGASGPAHANPLWLQLALEELNLLDADDFARADRQFTGTPEQRLHQMVLDVAMRLPADIDDLIGWLLARAEKHHGRDWTDAFVTLLALGRHGWRESDFQDLIPRLLADGPNPASWDAVRFAALRRSFRGQVVRRGAQEQWDFAHALLRRAIAARSLADAAAARALHARIADWLESLPPFDPIRREELMFHLMSADDRPRAARFYGADLPDAPLSGATRTLADAILAGMAGEPNAALEWVASLPRQEGLADEILYRLCNRFNFALSDAIANQATLATRRDVLEASQSGLALLKTKNAVATNCQHDLCASHQRIGDVLLAQGNLNDALAAYRQAMAIAERLATADAGNADWQRDLSVSYAKIALSVSHGKIGDVLRAQGNLTGALAAYREFIAIAKRVAAAVPSDRDLQRNLSVSQAKIGDVLLAQGNLTGALAAYRECVSIAERLAAADPGDVDMQCHLSISQNMIGHVLAARGNLTSALAIYGKAHEILKRLAAADPGNAGWQRELCTSNYMIGDVLLAQGNLNGALDANRESMAIAERLAAADPGNTDWQCQLSLSHGRTGDVLAAQGSLTSALDAYEKAHEILKRLAASDPSNAKWQHDLSVSRGRIGEVLQAQGNLNGALAAYREAMAIDERLAASDPSNAEGQHALSVSHGMIGEVLQAQGNLNGALAAYREAMAIDERLAASDPSNAEWQNDLARSNFKLAGLYHSKGDSGKERECLFQCREVLRKMKRSGMHLDPQIANLLAALERMS